MGRFLLRLVTTRWGWTLIAALIVLGGSLWGISSPTIAYQNSQNVSYIITAANNGDVYIWTTDNANFFVARHADFNPPIDRTQIHLDNGFTFVDRADTIPVDQSLVDNVHATQAHVIEKLVLYSASGNVVATYTSSEYKANPNGFHSNRWWPGGIAAILIGLLMGYVALFVGRKKRPGAQPAAAGTGPGEWPYSAIPPYPTAPPTKPGQKP